MNEDDNVAFLPFSYSIISTIGALLVLSMRLNIPQLGY